jgi:hypothetical protein
LGFFNLFYFLLLLFPISLFFWFISNPPFPSFLACLSVDFVTCGFSRKSAKSYKHSSRPYIHSHPSIEYRIQYTHRRVKNDGDFRTQARNVHVSYSLTLSSFCAACGTCLSKQENDSKKLRASSFIISLRGTRR